ncbi:MAG: Maf family protein [Verrucomicrobia bacterium]|nr:Maf family protein [Verrucomicrobiota bacterium]
MPVVSPFILASASPRRRELLAALGVRFDVVVADVVEHEDPLLDPRVMVARNAALKADWVAQRNPAAWVLGADTTVFVDGRALNKPADLAAARAMLRRLSGRSHTVFTGVALRHAADGVREDFGVASEVVFHPLSDAVIEEYLARVHVLDKAGAYAIQEHAALLVAEQRGSLSNIIGLPQDEVRELLTRHRVLP